MSMARILPVIAAGGVIGTLCRLGVSEAVGPWDGSGFPMATLLVNLFGCLAIGVLAAWPALAHERRPWARPFLITGVLGGFTTFSGIALEVGVLLESARVPTMLGYLGLTLAGGIAAVAVGRGLVERLARP
ncbi:MAG: CrcB family protein [Actinomycetales bacterium]|nr:CrcB family protein [Actinomycetales bacterium]